MKEIKLKKVYKKKKPKSPFPPFPSPWGSANSSPPPLPALAPPGGPRPGPPHLGPGLGPLYLPWPPAAPPGPSRPAAPNRPPVPRNKGEIPPCFPSFFPPFSLSPLGLFGFNPKFRLDGAIPGESSSRRSLPPPLIAPVSPPRFRSLALPWLSLALPLSWPGGPGFPRVPRVPRFRVPPSRRLVIVRSSVPPPAPRASSPLNGPRFSPPRSFPPFRPG